VRSTPMPCSLIHVLHFAMHSPHRRQGPATQPHNTIALKGLTCRPAQQPVQGPATQAHNTIALKGLTCRPAHNLCRNEYHASATQAINNLGWSC
jgi:hypothetical protein